jgi:hypothetical protein
MLMLDERHGTTVTVGEAHFETPKISVRALIRTRVELELERQHSQIKATVHETRLNGSARAFGPGLLFGESTSDQAIAKRDALVALAEEGFTAGRYFVLLDDRQAETLDEEIDIASTVEALFLMLTPLQGG